MTDQSTPLDIDVLNRLADAATEGPWSVDKETCDVRTPDGRALVNVLLGDSDTRDEARQAVADGAFIAAARAAVPALLAEVERLCTDQRESDQLRERMSRLLTDTAAALKGEPPPLVWHDWSDLPAVAAAMVAEAERQRPVLEAAKAVVAGWREEPDVADSGWISDEARALTYACERYVAGTPVTEED